MLIAKQQTMQVRVSSELIEREVASITRFMKQGGSVVDYSEPLLATIEVVAVGKLISE